jgi:hypothetical protein
MQPDLRLSGRARRQSSSADPCRDDGRGLPRSRSVRAMVARASKSLSRRGASPSSGAASHTTCRNVMARLEKSVSVHFSEAKNELTPIFSGRDALWPGGSAPCLTRRSRRGTCRIASCASRCTTRPSCAPSGARSCLGQPPALTASGLACSAERCIKQFGLAVSETTYTMNFVDQNCFSAPLTTRCLIPPNQAACLVWDKKPVTATVFFDLPDKMHLKTAWQAGPGSAAKGSGGNRLCSLPLASSFHLSPGKTKRTPCTPYRSPLGLPPLFGVCGPSRRSREKQSGSPGRTGLPFYRRPMKAWGGF